MTWRTSADAPPNVREIDETRLIMRGDSPLTGPGDGALVEDTSQPGSPIVCCTYLWRQTWAYEGVAFGVGRPENVATSAAYRGWSLVRAIFDLVHARSAAEGHIVQEITGIPYYSRRLGYAVAAVQPDLRGGVPAAGLSRS